MERIEMNIIPTNKRLLIEVAKKPVQEVETRSFLLPEEIYTEAPSEYTRAVVKAVAFDAPNPAGLETGSEIIIPTHLIEKVVVGKEEFNFIPANYVMCIIIGN